MDKPNSAAASKWLERLLESPHALLLLFFLSLLESIILPLPLELILIPFMFAQRERIWLIASVTLAGCLVGASIGYSVGLWLFESAGQWLINYFGIQQAYQDYDAFFASYGFWAIVAVGVTPIPFQVGMLTAGAAAYPFLLYMLASILARGIRYYGLAALVLWLGEPALRLWQQHSRQVGVALTAIVIAIVSALIVF